MDWLQTLLDNSSTPVWTAFLLGLLTALSPCPLATNIAAIGFIGKDIENRRRIFWNGLLYTLGRILSYALLGVVLILVLKEGSSMFGIQKTIGVWGELVLGPLLFLIGLFMLLGDRLNLPQFGFQGNAEGLARKGGWGALIIGALFALAFCPTSGVFYFGMLIPMSATATAGYLLPVVFAIATAKSRGPSGCGNYFLYKESILSYKNGKLKNKIKQITRQDNEESHRSEEYRNQPPRHHLFQQSRFRK